MFRERALPETFDHEQVRIAHRTLKVASFRPLSLSVLFRNEKNRQLIKGCGTLLIYTQIYNYLYPLLHESIKSVDFLSSTVERVSINNLEGIIIPTVNTKIKTHTDIANIVLFHPKHPK